MATDSAGGSRHRDPLVCLHHWAPFRELTLEWDERALREGTSPREISSSLCMTRVARSWLPCLRSRVVECPQNLPHEHDGENQGDDGDESAQYPHRLTLLYRRRCRA